MHGMESFTVTEERYPISAPRFKIRTLRMISRTSNQLIEAFM